VAKVFYIGIKDKDSVQAYFFNNKRNAHEKGLELYGVGITDFSFDLDGEEFEGDNGTTYIYSGIKDVKEGFLFYKESGEPHFEAGDEASAKANIIEGLINGMGGYFPGKLKGGYGEIYMSSAVEGTNSSWTFENDDIYEKTKTKTTMRHIPTFESFINEARAVKNTESEKIIFDSPADMAKGIIDYFKQYDYTLDDKYDENWYSDLIKKNFIPTNKNTSTNMDHQLNLTDKNGKKVKGAFGLVNLYVDRDSEKLAVIISIGKP